MGVGVLNRSEVAALAQVSRRQVDKAIENRVLREDGSGPRRLPAAAVEVLTALHANSGLPLPVQRALAEALITTRRGGAWITLGTDGLGFKRSPAVLERRRTTDRYLTLRERYLSERPDVMGGEPVVRGTRLPLRMLADRAADAGVESVAREYDVDTDAVWFAERWAAANPRVGRPPTRPTPVDPRARTRYIAARHARPTRGE